MENKFNIDRKIELNNGLNIPCIGFGTYQIRKKSEIENAIKIAYNTGYRLFDTATVYGNEKLIGDAIKKLKIPRNEIFLVTKIFKGDMTYEKTKKSIETSLKKLQSDYIDMVLIHWPEVEKSDDSKLLFGHGCQKNFKKNELASVYHLTINRKIPTKTFLDSHWKLDENFKHFPKKDRDYYDWGFRKYKEYGKFTKKFDKKK